ncbi:LytR/AlgR family response regulator transcription factor [Natronoflexus pectinivorans]|uniref:LytTR family two component transcriptional regulator n=1 Tax=Natronoflexus pectinivorans TaxID=682526 RepID=A0A4R2GLM7_9BACT|nr:LytTR family transcriptional regulator DNA-binding domain-containing protein [Natronoflexus pectinivorans]TCO09843.1 LytTR family two component transcriptional regulator [Natronoflexus pectinivorans]
MAINNFKVLIIDDEQPARQLVRLYLKNLTEIEIAGECSNGFDAMKMIKDINPDLIFLDIQMPKVNGLELLEVLEKRPNVIFTTAYDEYAIKAFDLNAVDYLLKPFSKERFDSAVKKALERVGSNSEAMPLPVEKIRESTPELLSRIVVKKGSGMEVIPINEIIFLEAQEDYVMIYTAKGRFMKNQTMSYYESHLNDSSFVRIHRSYIVNISKISRIEPYDKDSYVAIVNPDHKLRISRSGYKKLREQLGI